MWQSPTPIKSFFGKELTGRDAWIYVFAKTWEELEIDKKYPQKLLLSPEQRTTFMRMRNLSRDPGDEINDTHFMGVTIEEVAGAPGYLVAVDGAQVALDV